MMKFMRFGHEEMTQGVFQISYRLLAVSSVVLLMTACATAPQPRTPPPNEPVVEYEPKEETPDPVAQLPTDTKEADEDDERDFESDYVNNRDGIILPHMKGRDTKRLALLLPFSAQSSRLRDEASSMMKAAELSIFDRDDADVLLFALDTKGTPEGARSATQAAIQAGADVVLGPILAGSVKSAAREARSSGTPLIAFSTDQTVAGNGVYLLSFPPEAEVERIVDFAADTGAARFAFLGPNSEYGRRVQKSYEKAIQNRDGQLTASETYSGRDISVMQEPAKRLADKHKQAERIARQNGNTTPMAFEAIILPEGGTALRSLAPLLPYYDVDPSDVQLLGTGLWKNDETVREPALAGGVFAGPDPEAQERFETEYDRAFGEENERLASLAYDAVSIGAFVADGNPKTRKKRMQDPEGFYGADGFVRFEADGTPRRSLAVYQIKNGRFIVVDPASRGAGLGPS